MGVIMTIKEVCKKCGRKIKKKNLREHKITKELWCKRCLNRYGENSFYFNPNITFKEQIRVGKYTINKDEKKALVSSLRSSGMNYFDAWKEVNITGNYLSKRKRTLKVKRMVELRNKKEQEKKESELNKNFIKGMEQIAR